MRVATACKTCRSRKQRCDVNDNMVCCTYCESKGLPCSLVTRPRPRVSSSAATKRSSRGEATAAQAAVCTTARVCSQSCSPVEVSPLPPRDVCEDLVDVYFSTLHDTQGALFHRPSFMRAFEENTVPDIILLSISAFVARFSNHSYFDGVDRWDRGHTWGRAARNMLNIQTMEISIVTLQVCHLLSSLSIADGDPATEALCSGIANRVVQLLGLPHRLSQDPLQREIELRVWWSIYMMDVWIATGRGFPRTFHLDLSWPWPMEEAAFEQLGPDAAVDLIELDNDHILRKTSMWGQMIPLAALKAQIQDLNDSARYAGDTMDEGFLESVADLSSKLDQWVVDLPPSLHDTDANLAQIAERGMGHVFVALHFGYHYFAILLYYRFLHDSLTPNMSAQRLVYAQRCKFHATAITRLLWTGTHEHRCNCVWLLISHLLVISSSVHLHTLLLDTDPDLIAQARILLERNFIMLTNLMEVWPWLAHTMARLKSFHDACLRAPNAEDAFQMDDWMNTFLHQHSHVLPSDQRAYRNQLVELDHWEHAVLQTERFIDA